MKPRWLRSPALGALLGIVLGATGTLFADTGPQHQAPQGRPIKLGTSGGNIRDRSKAFCCGGTLGALVARGNQQYVLSNNHVLARTNFGAANDAIIQPGLIDQKPVCFQDAADTVARLSEWQTISFQKGTTNVVDAAIAAVAAGMVDPTGAILDLGPVDESPSPAAINMAVRKSGRTTGLTDGVVAAVSVTINVKYGSSCGGGRGTANFSQQIRVTPGAFSAGGDSGSLIVEAASLRPVGLLFAGGASDTFANPIQSVLEVFGVTMVGTSASGGLGFWKWLGRVFPRVSAAHAGSPGRRPVDPASQAAAHQAKELHEPAIMAIEGVVGVGVGASDVVPGEAAIEVYVEKSTRAVRAAVPARLDGVEVKIVETGEIRARGDSRGADR